MRTTIRLVSGSLSLVIGLMAGAAAAGPLDVPGAAKALACSACHGLGGQSPSSTIPIIAGIEPWYFKKAVEDYAAGRRPSPEMEPYAKYVQEAGVDDIAAYFASQSRQPTAVPVDGAAVARGRAASQQCVVCHGASGRGDPTKSIPDLRGQAPGYLRNQILLFKADRRSPGDPTLKALKELMKSIPDDAIADLAAYYSSLR
jgi:cytochrome c553